MVCNPHKVIYELKHAHIASFKRLKHFLLHTLYFTVSLAESCLFIKKSTSGTIFLIVYVYDIVINGSDGCAIESIISQINT